MNDDPLGLKADWQKAKEHDEALAAAPKERIAKIKELDVTIAAHAERIALLRASCEERARKREEYNAKNANKEY